ncbi:DUF4249 domain-containing protein [Patiriisocius marinus]|nr:DUF4249 domain-containing protein [Patiriisocius marinus]
MRVENIFKQVVSFIKPFCALFFSFMSLLSCTSDIEFENQTFEDVLVIDATITNEFQRQEVRLTRTYAFGEEPSFETDAMVKVLSNDGDILFEETEPGIYLSISAFKAEPNVDYQLLVITKNNRSYSSTNQSLTTETQIDNIRVDRIVNDDNVDGVAFLVDSFDPTNTAKFYKYEFIETFKVIAPMWVDEDAIVVSDVYPNCDVGLVPRSEDLKVCYRTEVSNQFNLATTATLTEDRVEGHMAHFLSNKNYKMSHRYSMLLKQFVLSSEGYEYLENLNRFTAEGSAFSQVQTGFLVGNIKSDTNVSEKVIGYFEVASVDSQRVFFNYTDFYPPTPLPPYIEDCFISAPPIKVDSQREICSGLINIINNGELIFFKEYNGDPVFVDPGPYYLVPRACGDCTALGTNIIPDFWIE